MSFTPVRSALQAPGHARNLPELYGRNYLGPLSALQASFDWRITYLCQFHQITYSKLAEQDAQIAEEYKRQKLIVDAVKTESDEEAEGLALAKSQMLSGFRERDDDIEKAKQLADEYTVIGLWATAEQYLGKTYTSLYSHVHAVPAASVNAPYKWQDFTTRFSTLGVNLASLDDLPDANECRVLNNAIKHSGKVEGAIAQYPFFATHQGEDLSEIPFQLQRYVNGVTHFISSLIGAASKLIDPAFNP